MPGAMALDLDLDEGLRKSNARFMVSINRILERYNQPFEDDLLISMETLTYNTCKGPKRWEEVSIEKLRKWKKEVLERTRGSQSNADLSKKQTSDFEDGHSTINQESPENSCMDTSDIVVGEESNADIASVRRQFENIHFQNHHLDDEKIQDKVKVQVDAIVQDSARKIPEWITIARQGSPKGLHLASPVQELIGNQASVCRRKVELSNECSSSRPVQLKFCDVPISPKRITVPRHQCSPRLDKTCFILEEYQSADDECSWGDITLADLYPSMVETLTRLMTKESRRKALKYMFGHFRHKKRRPRRLKLNVTVDKIRGFRPLKLKKALPSICSSRSEEIWNQTFGDESGELCDDNCAINNLSGQVPYSYIDKNEVKMNYSDSSLEHHLISGKGQKFSKHTVFPNVMATMGETFLVEDDLQPAVSLKNSKCKESEKLVYKCSSEYHFRTSAASSGSAVLHLVKDSKTRKTAFPCGDTSELCSSACSSYGNSNTSTLVTNCSPLRPSNALLPTPEKLISERRISFQCTRSFSSLSTKQSPSKMPQKYEDAFEKLYYKLCLKEIQTPLTRPLSNSQNLEKKGGLVKMDLSGSVMFNTQYDLEFNKIYKQLCSEAVPELPGIQRASHLRKYEGVQLSETVNALVNSPVRTLSAIPRVKRVGNFQNDLLCSPVKRLKNIPERYFTSPKCQQIPHRKNVNLQTVGMDFLSTCNGSNTSFFGSHNCQSQDSGFHASSDKTFLDIPSASLQESGIADAHSAWPRAMKNHSHPDNAQKHNKRISRKLSYTDGKDKKPSDPLDDFLVKTYRGTFTDCYSKNIVL
ncbi:LOW QUALITY PROTEIN: Holliday junction recognition protein [Cuculus canorus]|uniref:LOW QUALITY PROTEIN: Holliday junction recognition protein n=1 Tax=Cuculus canorus TaxID=55661 RepID=UPI0023AA61C7|nr:LOW QUALITY PROTEIN: Holliday junction recognition protein [Cuculus canorus]